MSNVDSPMVLATSEEDLLFFNLPPNHFNPLKLTISRFDFSFLSVSKLVDNRFVFIVGCDFNHLASRNVICIDNVQNETIDSPFLLSPKSRPTLIVSESKVFAFAAAAKHIWGDGKCLLTSDIFGEVLDTSADTWSWEALPPLPSDLPRPQHSLCFFINSFAIHSPSTIFLSFGSLYDPYSVGEFSFTYNISSKSWSNKFAALPFYGEAKFSDGYYYAFPSGMNRFDCGFLSRYQLCDDLYWVELQRFSLPSGSPYQLLIKFQSFVVSRQNTISLVRVKTKPRNISSPTSHFVEFDEIALSFKVVSNGLAECTMLSHDSYTSERPITGVIC